MVYVFIRWASYESRDFDKREQIREALRLKLESHGIRFLEYCWVWDENDQCLLVAGAYDRMEDACQWAISLESMGFVVPFQGWIRKVSIQFRSRLWAKLGPSPTLHLPLVTFHSFQRPLT